MSTFTPSPLETPHDLTMEVDLKVPVDVEDRGLRTPRHSSLRALDRIRQMAGDQIPPKDDVDKNDNGTSSRRRQRKRKVAVPKSEIDDETNDPMQPRKRQREARPRVQCDICLKTFDLYHLKAHKLNKHSNIKPSYPLLTDVKKGLDNNPYECPMKGCHARLKTVGFLKSHFILHLENNPYACPIPGCEVKCDAQCHLDRHMRQHTGKLQVKCPKCGLQLSRKDKLVTHKCEEYQKASEQRQTKWYKNKYAHLRLERIQNLKTEEVAPDPDPLDPDVMSAPIMEAKARVDIKSIFMSDPVFIKVCEEVPEFKELILGDGRGRPRPGRKTNARGGRSSKIKPCLPGKVGNTSSGSEASTTRFVKVEPDLIIQDEDEEGANCNEANGGIIKLEPCIINQEDICEANHNDIILKLESEEGNPAHDHVKTDVEMETDKFLKIEQNGNSEIKHEN